MTNSRSPLDIDYAILSRLEFLDPKGEAGLMQNLVKLYIESTPESMTRLRDAADKGTKQQLAKAAHAIKSGHSNLGVKPVVEILQQIEDLKFEDGELAGLLDRVEALSQQAGEELKKYLETKR